MAKEIKTALVSAYDKDGLANFVEDVLTEAPGMTVYGSRGSVTALEQAGLEAQSVSALTGSEPWLDHRVATLSEEVSAGLLADDTDDHQYQLDEKGIPRIDLVAVDLYPLIQTVRNPDATRNDITEKTDVGGPTMLHAAAKGRRLVVSRPEQRQQVIRHLVEGQPNDEEFRERLAAVADWEAARHIMESALSIGGSAMAGFMGERVGKDFKGENGPQRAGLYADRYAEDHPLRLVHCELKRSDESELSNNNWTDISRAMQTVAHMAANIERNFDSVGYMGIGLKHGNACSAGIADTPGKVIMKTIEGDQLALFGGTVTFNFPIDEKLATLLMKHNQGDGKNLLDVVVVPEVTDEALAILNRKEGRMRVVTNPALQNLGEHMLDKKPRMQSTFGGDMLVQDNYNFVLDFKDPEMAAIGNATPEQLRDIAMADAICRTSNSNTITAVRDGMLLANAVGQQARVYAAELAVQRAQRIGHSLEGASLASDSFFPFPDAPAILVEAGIDTFFTTTGSKKDSEVFDVFRAGGVNVFSLPDAKGRGFSHHAS